MEIINTGTYLGMSYWYFGDILTKMEMMGIVLGIAAIICFEIA